MTGTASRPLNCNSAAAFEIGICFSNASGLDVMRSATTNERSIMGRCARGYANVVMGGSFLGKTTVNSFELTKSEIKHSSCQRCSRNRMELSRSALARNRQNTADLPDLDWIPPNRESPFVPAKLGVDCGGQSSPTPG